MNSQQIMRMKGAILYGAIVGLLFTAGCGARRNSEVVVIERTKSYHTDACPRVNMANTKVMTVAEARALNCKPCKGCQPDKRQ